MIRMAQITDLHLDDAQETTRHIYTRNNVIELLDSIRNRDIRHIVVTGDIAEASAMGWFVDLLEWFEFSFYLLPGEHDSVRTIKTIYRKIEKQTYYWLDLEGFRCVFLDSSTNRIDQAQLKWLNYQIITSLKPIIMFLHHPVLDCCTVMDRQIPLKNRDEVQQVLDALRKPVTIYCGHYHIEESVVSGYITQFVTPSGYHQRRKWGDSIELASEDIGYRVICLDGTQQSSEVIMLPRCGLVSQVFPDIHA